MKELVLFDKSQNKVLANIACENDLVSLTDLWKGYGSDPQKTPAKWQETEQAKSFIKAACKLLNIAKNDIIKSRRGKGGGTYAHRQIGSEYAQYLNPEYGVIVNEVFFQRVEEEKNPDLIADRYIKAYQKRGKDEKWIQERFEGKVVRNTFTSTLAKHGVKHDGFRQCTNAIYSPLFGGKTDVIRQKKNLPEKANIRDNLSRLELMSVKFAEELASENIKNNNLQGNNECVKASFIASNAVKDCVLKSRQKINQTI